MFVPPTSRLASITSCQAGLDVPPPVRSTAQFQAILLGFWEFVLLWRTACNSRTAGSAGLAHWHTHLPAAVTCAISAVSSRQHEPMFSITPVVVRLSSSASAHPMCNSCVCCILLLVPDCHACRPKCVPVVSAVPAAPAVVKQAVCPSCTYFGRYVLQPQRQAWAKPIHSKPCRHIVNADQTVAVLGALLCGFLAICASWLFMCCSEAHVRVGFGCAGPCLGRCRYGHS